MDDCGRYVRVIVLLNPFATTSNNNTLLSQRENKRKSLGSHQRREHFLLDIFSSLGWSLSIRLRCIQIIHIQYDELKS